MCNANAIKNFEQRTTEALSVVCIIDLGESKQRIFAFPLAWTIFFDPVASNCKVSVCVASLPPVACNIDGSANRITLYDVY
jgi:hypothetical protein